MTTFKDDGSDAARADRSRKQDVLKELQLLHVKEQNLERERCAQLYDRRGSVHTEFSQLQQLEQTFTANRKTNRSKLQQQLTKAKDAVRKFRQDLEKVTPTPDSVERLKVVIEDIECQISAIRDQQKLEFDELMKDERLLGQEVDALDRRFDSWSLPGAAVNGVNHAVDGAKSQRTAAIPSSRDVTADLPPEVAAFEVFLQQTGGHRGSWDEIDHSTFLKHRNRHKGKLSFVKELAGGLLPTHSEQEIRDHEAWYQEYLQLNDKKKEVIQRWREKKEIEREAAVASAEKSEGSRSHETDEVDEDGRAAVEQDREQQRQKISQWKVEKELQKAKDEELKVKRQLQQQRQAEVNKQKQLERKKMVSEYKALREKEEEQRRLGEMEKSKAEAEEKRILSAELTARYRDRDLETVRGKRDQQRREKERLEREKQQRLDQLRSQVEVRVNRDPQRLLRPTEGWKERQKSSGPSGNGPALQMPHRAVPTWRQGLLQ